MIKELEPNILISCGLVGAAAARRLVYTTMSSGNLCSCPSYTHPHGPSLQHGNTFEAAATAAGKRNKKFIKFIVGHELRYNSRKLQSRRRHKNGGLKTR